LHKYTGSKSYGIILDLPYRITESVKLNLLYNFLWLSLEIVLLSIHVFHDFGLESQYDFWKAIDGTEFKQFDTNNA
jgi:hypothetical protein